LNSNTIQQKHNNTQILFTTLFFSAKISKTVHKNIKNTLKTSQQ